MVILPDESITVGGWIEFLVECFRGVTRLFRWRSGYGFGGGKDKGKGNDMRTSAVAHPCRKGGGKDGAPFFVVVCMENKRGPPASSSTRPRLDDS